MFSVFRVFAFLLCSMVMVPAFAGTQSGTVTGLAARNTDGLLYFYLSGAATGKPGCATATYWVIKDENSNAGKRLLAILLSAKMTGQAINVVGTGNCTRWVDGEDVETITI
ncbi:hypothetical protein ABIE30_002960 [Janthinobacterium lividum]|uniref:hypothetical protein n=1 Tax=Janthinobacterium lividum TaxID=29581 RepID=UPI003D242B49